MPSKSKSRSRSRSKSSSRSNISISPEQKPLDHNIKRKTKKNKTKSRKIRSSVLHSLNTDKDFENIIKRMELLNKK